MAENSFYATPIFKWNKIALAYAYNLCQPPTPTPHIICSQKTLMLFNRAPIGVNYVPTCFHSVLFYDWRSNTEMGVLIR